MDYDTSPKAAPLKFEEPLWAGSHDWQVIAGVCRAAEIRAHDFHFAAARLRLC
jgi:hypothetical protein